MPTDYPKGFIPDDPKKNPQYPAGFVPDSSGSTQGTPITDTSTIGPQPSAEQKGMQANQSLYHSAVNSKFPYIHPLDAIGEATRQGLDLTTPIENYTQAGRAENPIKAGIGDITSGAKELGFGGQAVGKPMGTSSGVVNNPVTAAMSMAPKAAGVADAVGSVISNPKAAATRILRGPGGYGPVETPLPRFINRELEAKVPMNEPPTARGEMESDINKGKQERLAAHDEMNRDLANKHEDFSKQVTDQEQARQKELGDQEKLRNMDARSHFNQSAYSQRQAELSEAAAEKSHADFADQLSGAEKARQGELTDRAKLNEQWGTALNNREGEEPQISLPAGSESAPESVGKRITPGGEGQGTPRVGNEGSAARWKSDDAMRILRDPAATRASKAEAAMTLTRRGIELPPNYRYLLGDANPGGVVYNPRDVTKFTPEGTPIRQGGKKLTKVLDH